MRTVWNLFLDQNEVRQCQKKENTELKNPYGKNAQDVMRIVKLIGGSPTQNENGMFLKNGGVKTSAFPVIYT